MLQLGRVTFTKGAPSRAFVNELISNRTPSFFKQRTLIHIHNVEVGTWFCAKLLFRDFVI